MDSGNTGLKKYRRTLDPPMPCPVCKTTFRPRADEKRRGKARFCSIRCAKAVHEKGTEDSTEYLRGLYQTMGSKRIALKLGMNQKTVRRRLKDAGVVCRKNQLRANGYKVVNAPENHPNRRKNGQIFFHTLIATERRGRALTKEACVHHINMDSLDNRPENLVVLPSRDHGLIHHQMARITAQLIQSGLVRYTKEQGYTLSDTLQALVEHGMPTSGSMKHGTPSTTT